MSYHNQHDIHGKPYAIVYVLQLLRDYWKHLKYISDQMRQYTIMAFLGGGCPPTKMAIIVFLTEQRTKSDTFMTTV